jgi:hypothetical protein
MFIKRDVRKLSEIMRDERDDRTHLNLSKRC